MKPHESSQERQGLPKVLKLILPIGALAMVGAVAFGGEPLMHAVGQILPIMPHFQVLPSMMPHNPDIGMLHQAADVVTEL